MSPVGAPRNDTEPALGSCGASLRKAAGNRYTLRVWAWLDGPEPTGYMRVPSLRPTPIGNAAPPIWSQYWLPLPPTNEVVHAVGVLTGGWLMLRSMRLRRAMPPGRGARKDVLWGGFMY